MFVSIQVNVTINAKSVEKPFDYTSLLRNILLLTTINLKDAKYAIKLSGALKYMP
jgi:hypothetical protein